MLVNELAKDFLIFKVLISNFRMNIGNKVIQINTIKIVYFILSNIHLMVICLNLVLLAVIHVYRGYIILALVLRNSHLVNIGIVNLVNNHLSFNNCIYLYVF